MQHSFSDMAISTSRLNYCYLWENRSAKWEKFTCQ